MKRFKYMLFTAAMLVAAFDVTRAQTVARSDADVRARVIAQVRASGLTSDQIRARLKSMGFSDDIINQILGVGGSDSLSISTDFLSAARALGVRDSTSGDSTRFAGDNQALLASIQNAIQNDTVRNEIERILNARALRPAGGDSGFAVFGRDVFARKTTQFDPAINGPLPPEYRIGTGDRFTVALSGDLNQTQDLIVGRDGNAFLTGVGPITAANLTFNQLRSLVSSRLATLYSGISTGRVTVSLIPTTLGTNQVFVLGDVKTPGAYAVSRLGTVLTALYAAGGPSDEGNGRAIDVKRNGDVVATVDLYDYLLSGTTKTDVRLNNGDVVFVRPRGPRIRVAGAVVRPATYELKSGENLGDAIRMAGGFLPEAEHRRLQIERVVPVSERQRVGSDKEVIDISSPTLATPVEAGDVVHVYRIADRIANDISVEGLGVWHPTRIAFVDGMRLSQAIQGAGGVKPDAYLGAVQISRLQPDSTRRLTRVGMRPDGKPADDIALMPHDLVTVYSIGEFRTQRFISVGGAVRKPADIPYQEGMTLRDAIMAAGGLEESALLDHAEIARLPESRANGVTATTIPVALDSTYLFERGPDGRYLGPPGVQAPAS
jgi:polysaccharide biosynthesis/export protein